MRKNLNLPVNIRSHTCHTLYTRNTLRQSRYYKKTKPRENYGAKFDLSENLRVLRRDRCENNKARTLSKRKPIKRTYSTTISFNSLWTPLSFTFLLFPLLHFIFDFPLLYLCLSLPLSLLSPCLFPSSDVAFVLGAKLVALLLAAEFHSV